MALAAPSQKKQLILKLQGCASQLMYTWGGCHVMQQAIHDATLFDSDEGLRTAVAEILCSAHAHEDPNMCRNKLLRSMKDNNGNHTMQMWVDFLKAFPQGSSIGFEMTLQTV